MSLTQFPVIQQSSPFAALYFFSGYHCICSLPFQRAETIPQPKEVLVSLQKMRKIITKLYLKSSISSTLLLHNENLRLGESSFACSDYWLNYSYLSNLRKRCRPIQIDRRQWNYTNRNLKQFLNGQEIFAVVKKLSSSFIIKSSCAI